MIFKAHFGRSRSTKWCTDVTKLVEECGLVDSALWCNQYFLCHMTCPNQLELGQGTETAGTFGAALKGGLWGGMEIAFEN